MSALPEFGIIYGKIAQRKNGYIPKMLKSVVGQYWLTGAATIVVAASAAYYVAFGDAEPHYSDKKQKRKAKNKLSGLVNEGNTCFINTTLQALASCPIFIWWIDSILNKQSKVNDLGTTSSLHMTMAGNLLSSNNIYCLPM